MNKEIELILMKLKIVRDSKENGAYICDREHSKLLLSYIEQLEKRNNNLKEDFKKHIDRINELTERNDKLQQENKQLENKYDKAIVKIQDIIDLGFDYDGLNQVNSLKGLIDDLVKIAKEVREILEGDSDGQII